jgi:SAM-dependent methyltransferase
MASAFSQPKHEPALERSERRARGVFYTPVEVAEWIVAQTYGPLLEQWNGDGFPPRLLDPACGGGVFLQAAEAMLINRCGRLRLSSARRRAALQQGIFGGDIDASAVKTAQQQLPSLPAENIRCADALGTFDDGRFDAVVGNPPYVSIRELAHTHSRAEIEALRKRFATARGNFDLYVPFWERALELLRPGGRLGFIVPNKWGTLDYARALRELLLTQTTMEQVVDVSALRIFPHASTYPQLVILKKEPPPQLHGVKVTCLQAASELNSAGLDCDCRRVAQAKLQASALVWGADLDVEQRIKTQPLGSLCALHSGASGYSAALMAGELQESAALMDGRDTAAFDFIVSGNIDRYAIAPGNVRFLKRYWQRPCLPVDAEHVSALKKRLYAEPKILFSGMCRRLEAAYDEQGLALGVQVFAARDLQVDPYYLLGILNSKLLSYLFRERFAAKRLAGGYLAINKGQLEQLPVAIPSASPKSLGQRIANLARRLQCRFSQAFDEQLDELVYTLYQLTASERARIERSFDEPSKRVAVRRAA